MNGRVSETAEGDGLISGRVQWRLFYNSTYELCLTTGKLDTKIQV